MLRYVCFVFTFCNVITKPSSPALIVLFGLLAQCCDALKYIMNNYITNGTIPSVTTAAATATVHATAKATATATSTATTTTTKQCKQ